jgi:hypothetical protein
MVTTSANEPPFTDRRIVFDVGCPFDADDCDQETETDESEMRVPTTDDGTPGKTFNVGKPTP